MKIHLGCGPKYFPGWYHIDALEYDHVDMVSEVNNLDFINEGSVEIVYASHLLEHFGRNEYKDVLRSWYRVLKPNGILRLAVPDFESVLNEYLLNRNIKDLTGLVIGGQKDIYDYHKMIFDGQLLTEALLEVGFSEVRKWDWRHTEHSSFDDFSQAYLPHLDKENGRLMSLNLEGIK